MSDARFKIESGLLAANTTANSLFQHNVLMTQNLRVEGDLLYVGGNLWVAGNLLYSNTTIAGDLTPTVDGAALGNATNRFDVFARNITVFGNLHPNSSGLLFGNSARRWTVFAVNVNATGTLTVSDATTLSGTLNVSGSTTLANVTANAITASSANITGAINIGGSATVSGNLTVGGGFSVGSFGLTHGLISTNTATVATTSMVVVDSYSPRNSARVGEYLVGVMQGVNVHTMTISFVHDGTQVYLTKHSEVQTLNLGSFDLNINTSADSVELQFVASSATSRTVRVLRKLINNP